MDDDILEQTDQFIDNAAAGIVNSVTSEALGEVSSATSQRINEETGAIDKNTESIKRNTKAKEENKKTSEEKPKSHPNKPQYKDIEHLPRNPLKKYEKLNEHKILRPGNRFLLGTKKIENENLLSFEEILGNFKSYKPLKNFERSSKAARVSFLARQFEDYGRYLKAFETPFVTPAQQQLLGSYSLLKKELSLKGGFLNQLDKSSGKIRSYQEAMIRRDEYNKVVESGQSKFSSETLEKVREKGDVAEKLIEGELNRHEELLDKLLEIYTEANETLNKEINNEQDIRNKANKDRIYETKYQRYERIRKKGFRTKEETAELRRVEGNYSWADAKDQILFNKAVGYRQRQGLGGFLANIGYAKLGTIAAIGLGAFGVALSKATKHIIELGKASVEAYSSFESIKTNLGIVYSSQTEADSLFSEITKYAIKSPFNVETVSSFAVQLKQSGIYSSNLLTTLKQIGDVAGGNQAKFGNIANAFAQIEANGKATTRQLRQFATAGIPIYAQLSKQLNKSVEQIRKMTEEGQITANVIEEAFAQLTGPGGQFENAVNIGAKLYSSRKINLEDSKNLALAEIGEGLINFGGKTSDESIAKWWLNFRESFWTGLYEWQSVQNIEKSVKQIENRDKEISKLEGLIKYAEEKGDKGLKKYAEKEIERLKSLLTPSQERAEISGAYTYYKAIAESESENILKTLADIQNAVAKFPLYFVPVVGAGVAILSNTEEAKYQREESKRNRKLPTKLTQKKAEEFITDPDNKYAYTISKLEEDISSYNDLIKTFSEKNDNSLYLFSQKASEKWKNTPKGKEEIEKEEEKNYRELYEQYKNYEQYLNEKGELLSREDLTSSVFEEIIKSGIINPYTKIQLTPESLEKNENLEQLKTNINSIARIKFNDEQLEKDILNLRDIVSEQNINIKDLINAISNISNSYKEGDNKSLVNSLLGYISSYYTIGASPKSWEELNEEDEKTKKEKEVLTYPLWQRILSNSLGIDLSLFKSKEGGFITNGKQAIDIFEANSKRNTVANISKAMLNSLGVKDTFKYLSYSGPQARIPNNSMDGTKQIDWKQTYENFTDFAISLESATEVTKAYAESVNSDIESLRNFLTSSITQTEDPSNIYSKDYQSQLGELSKSIKAIDANAFDMMFEDLGNGFIKLRENATEAAESLLKQKEASIPFIESIASMKGSIDSIKSETYGKKGSVAAYSNIYGKVQGLDIEENATILSQLYDLKVVKELLKKNEGDLVFEQNLIKSIFSRDSNKLGGLLGVLINNGNYESARQILIDAKRQEFEKENTSFRTGYDENGKEIRTNWSDLSENLQTSFLERYGLDPEWISNSTKENYKDAYNTFFNKDKQNSLTNEATELIDAFEKLVDASVLLSSVTKKEAYTKTSQKLRENYNNISLLKSMTSGIPNYKGNSMWQQKYLNLMGANEGTLFEDYISTVYKDENGMFDKTALYNLYNFTKGSKDIDNLYNAIISGTSDPEAFNKFLNKATRKEYRLMTKNTELSNLGKSLKDTFDNSLLDGFNNSLQSIGKSIRDGISATENFGEAWREVGEAMLSSMGPAMAQAGLSLITSGNYETGIALLLASGVVNVLSGFLNNEKKDSDKQQEQRLQNLKDLLSDIIQQAKSDAEYYEKNVLHRGALSEAESLSNTRVNDAIIAPNGNIITTHPQDYLVAVQDLNSISPRTSTPVINFQMIDQSTGVKTKEIRQTQNADGSIDVIAVVIDKVAEAVATGELDGAFNARDVRINGKSYAY